MVTPKTQHHEEGVTLIPRKETQFILSDFLWGVEALLLNNQKKR